MTIASHQTAKTQRQSHRIVSDCENTSTITSHSLQRNRLQKRKCTRSREALEMQKPGVSPRAEGALRKKMVFWVKKSSKIPYLIRPHPPGGGGVGQPSIELGVRVTKSIELPPYDGYPSPQRGEDCPTWISQAKSWISRRPSYAVTTSGFFLKVFSAQLPKIQ